MKTKPKRKSFNWLTALNRAVKKEPSKKEYTRLRIKAGDWPTCACGSLCERLPRTPCGAPIDSVLGTLGVRFARNVETRHWTSALATLYQIEARTAELLRAKK